MVTDTNTNTRRGGGDRGITLQELF